MQAVLKNLYWTLWTVYTYTESEKKVIQNLINHIKTNIAYL